MTAIVSNKLWAPEERLAWQPPEALTVSECADKYRVLRRSAKSGQWETDFQPFLRGIMDAFAVPSVEEIWFMKPSQVGGTEALLNMLLYAVLQDCGDSLVVLPTEDLAREIATDRFDLMVDDCDRMKAMLSTIEGENIKLKKTFSGMTVYFAWAGSPTALASRPIRYLFLDEIDKYPAFTGDEASPLSLAKERTESYRLSRKIVYMSTPTTETKYIYQGESTCAARFRYFVPCPHCGHRQMFDFKNVMFGTERDSRIVERIAWYECESCAGQIYNDSKRDMVLRGEWVDINSSLKYEECMRENQPRRVGFQLSRLYSVQHSFGAVAAEFLDSKSHPERLMNWRNSWMAEVWSERVETKTIMQLQENVSPLEQLTCPRDSIALTCGIDQGQRGFWFTVIAWQRDMTCHLVHYGFLTAWEDLTKLVWENTYQIEGEEENDEGEMLYMKIWRSAIDTGGSRYEGDDMTQTEAAYAWLRQFGRGRVFGFKGASGRIKSGRRMHISKIDKTPANKPIPGGLSLLLVDTPSVKEAIHFRLEIEPAHSGRFTFHHGTGEDYMKHLHAEEKRRNRKGLYEWVKISNNNHLLDATVIAFALADVECQGGLRVLRNVRQRLQKVNMRTVPENQPPVEIIKKPAPFPQRRRRVISRGPGQSWVKSW
ncbi:MAG TPA: terminase gpA endonuclease subunit [Dissulfurispiraceae bacterium]|nr:terminase gpA endonuclease subunit [Dissulfurispiraceae bacterium]